MLRDLEVSASVACLLAPFHAATVRSVLDRLRRDQAVLAIVPDDAELASLLCCEDFSSDLDAHRLWLVGAKVERDIERIYDHRVALPVPGQFIRPAATHHDVEPLISISQQAFSRVVASIPPRLESIRARDRERGTSDVVRRICVVAPGGFRLWRDTTPALLHAISETDGRLIAVPIDTDVPSRSAPIALAESAVGADAILAADLGRGDVPGMVSEEKPWVTWVTTRRVPPRVATARRDRLILVDPSLVPLAIQAGWERRQLQIAGWPDLNELIAPGIGCNDGDAVRGNPHLLMLVDLPPRVVPPEIDQFSSHGVLWNAIQDELRGNPAALHAGVPRYLDDRARRLGIDPNQLARQRFLEHCIPSACAIGVALRLADAGLPLRVGGAGWDDVGLPEGVYLGPIRDRSQFASLVRAAAALVSAVAPDDAAHPIRACNRPVVHAFGREPSSLLADAKALLSGVRPRLPLRGRCISGPLLFELFSD